MHRDGSQDLVARRRIPAGVTENYLFYGDNLDVLRKHVQTESVDLVYLDPPFNSKVSYNILYAERDGSQAAAQIKAFEDTWHWDRASVAAFHEVVERGGPVSQAMQAFRTFLGDNDVLAYLAMMAPRLLELHRVLKATGSIYLHCDPTAGHYLKLLMDAVFGPRNFRNEIVWRRTGSNSAAKRFGPLHQLIYYYVKSPDAPYYPVVGPYTKGYVADYFTEEDERGQYRPVLLTGPGTRQGESGRPWRGYDPTSSKRHWQPATYIYEKYHELTGDDLGKYPLLTRLDKLDEVGLVHWPQKEGGVPNYKYYLADAPGVALQDTWAYQPGTEGCVYGRPGGIDQDVKWLSTKDRERLGYPTQKPEGVLERIIRSSSREGDLVLDPFCGCGTAIAVAQRLNRHWIGIDITHLALGVIRHRFAKDFPGGVEFTPVGEPVTLPDAETLAGEDPWQFQWWVLGLLGVNPIEQKKGADRGIDGRLYFHERDETKTREIVISVKAGRTGAGAVRDLRGVVEREQAALGVFVTIREPTKPMKREAASAGFYESASGRFYPRLQILSVAELLEGRNIDYPVTGPGLARPPEEPEQLVLREQPPPRRRRPARKAVPDLVNDLLSAAGINRPPVRLEPILEQLNMEMSADPRMREDAMLVPMSHPDEPGPPSAWMVYYNPSKSEARRRFTVAHEVGHVLLHGEPLAAAARGGGGRKNRERDVERFAAELLMPREFVLQAASEYGTDVERLRALFQVSRQAMQIRLREFGLG